MYDVVRAAVFEVVQVPGCIQVLYIYKIEVLPHKNEVLSQGGCGGHMLTQVLVALQLVPRIIPSILHLPKVSLVYLYNYTSALLSGRTNTCDHMRF